MYLTFVLNHLQFCSVVELQRTTWNTASYTVSKLMRFTENHLTWLFLRIQYVVFFLSPWKYALNKILTKLFFQQRS